MMITVKGLDEIQTALLGLAEYTCGVRDSIDGLALIEEQRLDVEQQILAELQKMNRKFVHTLVLKLGTPVPQ